MSIPRRLPIKDQSEQRRPYLSSGTGHFACVLCRTEYHEPSMVRPLPEPLEVGLRRMPLVYGFVVEMHSFLHRMVARYRRHYGAYLLYVGPFEEGPSEHPEPNKRTHACMRDIRSFVEHNPWATTLDLEMYRDSWLAGVEWQKSNSCKRETDIDLEWTQNTSANIAGVTRSVE
jgi:hypothetical protein